MWIALVAALLGCAWLFLKRRDLAQKCESLIAERDQLRSNLEVTEMQKGSFQKEIIDFKTQIEVLKEKQRGIVVQHKEAQEQAQNAFKALAKEALNDNNNTFLQIAGERFSTERSEMRRQLDGRKQAVQRLIQPVKDALQTYDQFVKEAENKRQETYGVLTEGIKLLGDRTDNLVQALRRPEVRGKWGEITLERIAKLAGMTEHCDFDLQHSYQAEDGPRRPDMVVKLPNDRTIIIDAKTPLDAFLSAVECANDDERSKLFEQHTKQLEAQVRNLSSKQYEKHSQESFDFIVLFIPGESFLFPAVERRPNLIEDAIKKNVIIATPVILISLLKVIAIGWREEQIAENARKISNVGRELHDRLQKASEYIQKLGNSLGKAVEQYDQFVGTFESRVLVSARKFEGLGVDVSKSLPDELNQLAVSPRELKHEKGDSSNNLE